MSGPGKFTAADVVSVLEGPDGVFHDGIGASSDISRMERGDRDRAVLLVELSDVGAPDRFRVTIERIS